MLNTIVPLSERRARSVKTTVVTPHCIVLVYSSALLRCHPCADRACLAVRGALTGGRAGLRGRDVGGLDVNSAHTVTLSAWLGHSETRLPRLHAGHGNSVLSGPLGRFELISLQGAKHGARCVAGAEISGPIRSFWDTERLRGGSPGGGGLRKLAPLYQVT